MTHHLNSKSLLDKVRSSRRSFEHTRCNWCQTEANYWTSLSEDNFVKLEGKILEGEQAFAVFCPNCLKDPAKKEEIKYAFTINEAVGEDFIPSQIPARELRESDSDPEGVKWPGDNPVEPPQPEPVVIVQGRGDPETGTRVAETKTETKEDPKKKKGLFG